MRDRAPVFVAATFFRHDFDVFGFLVTAGTAPCYPFGSAGIMPGGEKYYGVGHLERMRAAFRTGIATGYKCRPPQFYCKQDGTHDKQGNYNGKDKQQLVACEKAGVGWEIGPEHSWPSEIKW
jgi:hypothetical protein